MGQCVLSFSIILLLVHVNMRFLDTLFSANIYQRVLTGAEATISLKVRKLSCIRNVNMIVTHVISLSTSDR